MKIKIISDAIKVTGRVANQVRFATARALTEAALLAKSDAVRRLPTYFHIRAGWVSKGFRVLAANKTMLRAAVGHYEKNNFMKAQAEGGKKSPHGSEQAVPVAGASFHGPMGGIAMPRGTHGERATYRGSNWPKQLIAQVKKADAALKQSREGPTARNRRSGALKHVRAKATAARLVFMKNASTPTIAIRTSSGKGKGHYRPLWFLLKHDVKIPKRWGFYEDAEAAVVAGFSPLFKNFVQQYAGDVKLS